MPQRDMIEIDEEKCNGCGDCVSACAEGALQIVNGKARLVRDDYCDGLGACLGECPTGALKIVKREAAPFDAAAVAAHTGQTHTEGEHVNAQHGHPHPGPAHAGEADAPGATAGANAKTDLDPAPLPCGCPGTMQKEFTRKSPQTATPGQPSATGSDLPSALTHWPIQLKLANPEAPHFRNADLLIAADCVAASTGIFHTKLLPGKRLVMACPKLDNPEGYVEKLAALLAPGHAVSVTLARMEVPCCGGLVQLVKEARKRVGRMIPIREIVIGLQGDILRETVHEVDA